ncbi:MAG: serine/threonine protein kinase [Chloroflexi bacterium]|nr:serine/threonine protein kinase [Chloroflexota bacterium]
MAEERKDDSSSLRNTSWSNLSDLTGITLGKYRLIEKLGQGGMAQVYKAYQPDLERYVAIKVLHPHLTGDEEFAARFRHEAKAIAALEHPHIVRVYDFDANGGLAFLVMEYLSGTSLKARLRELNALHAHIEFAETVRLVAALADALAYAHHRGVIHRDVKPSNVILTTDGRPVLSDFGIARIIDATIITNSSGSVGTPAYMSPEQGKGDSGDERSDIYALGVVMYQLSTGHLPFDADTPYAIILKHMTAPLPPPRTLRPDLPEAIERVILKALAKNPSDRYQTAAEFASAVRAAIEPPTVPAPPIDFSPAPVRHRSFELFNHRPAWLNLVLVLFTMALCVILFMVSAPWRTELFLAKLAQQTHTDSARSTLTVQGPNMIVDTWLDPDTPDESWHTAEFAQLQGADKPDRILLAANITRVPTEAAIISATLGVRVVRWGNDPFSGKIVLHQMATLWRASIATYNTPWSAPGLIAGRDYDRTPLDIAPLPESGWVTLNVTPAVVAWHERSRLGGGLLLMLSEDSHPSAHFRVYMTDHPDSASRPILTIAYQAAQ